MAQLRGSTTIGLALILALALAACGDNPASPSQGGDSASSAPSPTADAGTTSGDLSAIACATEDPDDVGELTGAWQGSKGGVYYIRQVGDCVWWFGTELDQIEPGVTGQPGFANVASGRVNGPLVQMEWADLPLGDILGGGGITLVNDAKGDELRVTQQRGDWVEYGDRLFTRIKPQPASPAEGDGSGSSTPSPSAGASTTATDLSAIACATEDPEDIGILTGAWQGSEGGIYYIRHVGDCVWWFGTEVDQIEPGVTGQGGFANVASGRTNGPLVRLEWADLPLGDVLGGGGLTLLYDAEADQLRVIEQRGDWEPFGARSFMRIQPQPSPSASASP